MGFRKNTFLCCVCFITGFLYYYDKIKSLFPEIDVHCFIRKPIEVKNLAARLKQELNVSQ